MSTQPTQQPTQNEAANASSKKSIIFGVGIVVVAMVLLALSGFIFFGEKEDIITGQVEVDEVRIAGKVPVVSLSSSSAKARAYIVATPLYASIRPNVLAKLEQAQAAKSAAEAQSQKAQAGARKEQKEGAYEMWQKAKAGLEVAEKSFERVERLYKEGVPPRTEVRRSYRSAQRHARYRTCCSQPVRYGDERCSA